MQAHYGIKRSSQSTGNDCQLLKPLPHQIIHNEWIASVTPLTCFFPSAEEHDKLHNMREDNSSFMFPIVRDNLHDL